MTVPLEINKSLLHQPLQLLLGDAQAQVIDFSIKTLKPGLGNPTSLGVYRVSGKSNAGDFSMVVKHLATGNEFMDASKPTYWNYWLREIDFFESPIAQRIPASLGYPKYLGQTRLSDGTALFWNSDLGDLEKTVWSWEDCLEAARIVAELNSIKTSDFDDYIWLNRSQPEGWLAYREGFFLPVLPLVAERAHSTPERAKAFELYGLYLPKQELMGEILHAGRQTFIHGDFNLNNLVHTKGNPSVIALDWQLCGVGRVGMEVASIFNTAYELGFIEATKDQFEQICSVYTARFNELNPSNPVQLDEVRLTAAACGQWILSGVGFFLIMRAQDETDAEYETRIDAMVDFFSTGPMMIYCSILDELL